MIIAAASVFVRVNVSVGFFSFFDSPPPHPPVVEGSGSGGGRRQVD